MIVETMTQKDLTNYIKSHKIYQKLMAIARNDERFSRKVYNLSGDSCAVKRIEYDRNCYYVVVRNRDKVNVLDNYIFLKLFNRNHYEFYKLDVSVAIPSEQGTERKRCVWKISNHFIQRYTDRWEENDVTNETCEQFLKRLVLDFSEARMFPETFYLDGFSDGLKDTDSVFISTRTGIVRCILDDKNENYVYATYYKENKSSLFKEVRDWTNEHRNWIDNSKFFIVPPDIASIIFIERKETETEPRTIYAFDGTGKFIARTETGWELNEEPKSDTLYLDDYLSEQKEPK